jgi:asparagine synthase (glutamine-hydrolysing)
MIEYGGTYPGAYLLRRGLFMPWELKGLLGEEMAHEGLRRLAPVRAIDDTLQPRPRHAFARVAAMEASLYMRNQLLRDTDWASMAHSLEVRVPLVDSCILQKLASIVTYQPELRSKDILANSPSTPLPSSITQKRKTGFTVPVGKWLEGKGCLDVWRKVPQLAKPGIHWARRWAFAAGSLEMEQ